MRSTITYGVLFKVICLHEYFVPVDKEIYEEDITDEKVAEILSRQQQAYNIHDSLTIEPTKDCQEIIKNHKLIFKKNNTGFLIGIKARRDRNNLVPFVPFEQPLRLRFGISISNPMFANFTNLSMDKRKITRDPYVYHFTNKANNIIESDPEDILYLSRKIQPYNPQNSYEAGELIRFSTKLYEAKKDLDRRTLINLNEWQELFADFVPKLQFTTSADRFLVKTSVFEIDLTHLEQRAINVLIRNENNEIVHEQRFISSDSNTTVASCLINLSQLQPALYHASIQNLAGTRFLEEDFSFYLDDELYLKKELGIIECHFNPTKNLGKYNWFESSENPHLQEPNYTIRWKNRSTWWRYYFQDDFDDIVSNDLEKYTFPPNKELDNVLVSKKPLGLTQLLRTITFTADANQESMRLENPGISPIFPEGGKVYSEINMGGGLGPPVEPETNGNNP